MTAVPILTIEIPGRAVSANARVGYKGRRKFITKEARDWRKVVAGYAYAAGILMLAGDKKTHKPRLPLRIVCHVRGVRGDADNYAKLICDGLKDGICIDDRHFRTVEMHATAKGLKQPGVTIEVYEAEESAAA